MSVETVNKSVFIEGDKTYFASKGAIDRLKRDLKNDDKEKLEKNDYFKEDWTYQILSNENNEIKIKIVNKKEVIIDGQVQPRVLDCDEMTERRNMLKKKLKEMSMKRGNIKTKLSNTVPKDLIDAYSQLKRFKLPAEVPNPEQVMANKDKYKDMIHTMVQSFGNFRGNNNPVINYYKLLAKHLNLSITPMSQQQQQILQQQVEMLKNKSPQEIQQILKQYQEEQQSSVPTKENSFLDQIREKRDNAMKKDVDNEMSKIYESMGLNLNEKRVKLDDEAEDTDDTDISDILKKMGINSNKEDINL
jgi:hypothetical protein